MNRGRQRVDSGGTITSILLIGGVVLLSVAALLAPPSYAQTIYRCTTSTGQALFSSVPCKAASIQSGNTKPLDTAGNIGRQSRIAQLRRIAASRGVTAEQRAAAHDELNRYERGDCQMSEEEAFRRDKLYVLLGEGDSAKREVTRHQLIALLNDCFSGRRIVSDQVAAAAADATASVPTPTGGKVYRCKTSQGGYFWASNWCSTAGGVTVDVIDVPAGMPFKEQATLADQVIANRTRTSEAESSARDEGIRCGAIDRELGEIRARYAGGNYVAVDQVNRDQIRQRDLLARRNALRCATR